MYNVHSVSRVQFEIQDFFMRGYNNIKGTVAMRDKNIGRMVNVLIFFNLIIMYT